MFSCPLTEPITDGANDTVTVQLDPPARLPGQLDASVNPALGVIVPTFSGLPPKFVIVMVCDPLVPTFCEKFSAAGTMLIADGRGLGNGTGVTPKT